MKVHSITELKIDKNVTRKSVKLLHCTGQDHMFTGSVLKWSLFHVALTLLNLLRRDSTLNTPKGPDPEWIDSWRSLERADKSSLVHHKPNFSSAVQSKSSRGALNNT